MKFLRKEKVKEAREAFIFNKIGVILLTLSIVFLILLISLFASSNNTTISKKSSVETHLNSIESDTKVIKQLMSDVDEEIANVRRAVLVS